MRRTYHNAGMADCAFFRRDDEAGERDTGSFVFGAIGAGARRETHD
ncbi:MULTISPECIES: hypothetical protein [unclassified Bradyrhizobium]|nr:MULTISPECIES: hypothetical protein [unclassified Bradyrhizobium]